MDNSKSDNHFELISRRHSSRDANPTQAPADRENKRLSLAIGGSDVTDRIDSIPYAEVTSMPMIATISGKRSSSTSVSGDATSTRSNSSKRRIKRNALTTSFLRRKRIEYAGMEFSMSFVLWGFGLVPAPLNIFHQSFSVGFSSRSFFFFLFGWDDIVAQSTAQKWNWTGLMFANRKWIVDWCKTFSCTFQLHLNRQRKTHSELCKQRYLFCAFDASLGIFLSESDANKIF